MSHVRKRCVVGAQLHGKCGVLSTCLGPQYDSVLLQARRARKALGKDGFLGGSASGTIRPDFGPETQLDRSVEKAASPMGIGDHWWTSSCDITEAAAEPSMPDAARVVRHLAQIIVGTGAP